MNLTRRKFLIGTGVAGGALVLGFSLREGPVVPHTRAGSFQPNAWLQITADGRFIFQLDKTEMGQGVLNAMPTVLAEELDIDPARFEVEMAGVHPAFRNRTLGVQITGGSTSIMSTWMPLREAGATARAMLVAAAAAQWRIQPGQCHTDDGEVVNGVTGERASYASLAALAGEQSPASAVTLKSPDQFRWIGRTQLRRDGLAKSTGQAVYGVDTVLPDMKIAVVVRCPHFGGTLERWVADTVTSMPGVQAAFEIHSGVAIVADTYWQARKAADVLDVSWNKGPLAGLDSAAIRERQQQALATESGTRALDDGDVAEAFDAAEQIVEAQYAAPYFHHSPMEPQNCTVLIQGDKAEVWSPSQSPDISRALVAEYAC